MQLEKISALGLLLLLLCLLYHILWLLVTSGSGSGPFESLLGGTWKIFPHRSRIWSCLEVDISYQLGGSKRLLSFISPSSILYHWLILMNSHSPSWNLSDLSLGGILDEHLDTLIWSSLISLIQQLVWGWIQRFMDAALKFCNNNNILDDSGYYCSLEDEVLWAVSSWDHCQVLCIIFFLLPSLNE